MSQGWITIFTGPHVEAEVVRAKLEAHGIPAFLHGDAMRPLALLGDFGIDLALDPSVQVPPAAAEAARACLEEREDESAVRDDERELPPDFFEAEPAADAAVLARARRLSRCIMWGAVFPLGAPFALWNLGPYLKQVQQLGRKPPLYKTTIAAAWLAPLNFVLNIVFIYLELRHY